LNDSRAMKKLRDIWVESDETKRRMIVNNIFIEIESFRGCYIVEEVPDEDGA